MKILSVTTLKLPDVKVIRFARFADHRGYFAEPFRRSDIEAHPEIGFLREIALPQMNESWSRAGVVRGLHFQWNPFMGKLVRTVSGRMVDIFMDIRLGSPTFGRAAMHDMPSASTDDYAEWIWVPPGFAHGNFFTVESRIEYLCSAEVQPRLRSGRIAACRRHRLVGQRSGVEGRVRRSAGHRPAHLRQGPTRTLSVGLAGRRALPQLRLRAVLT